MYIENFTLKEYFKQSEEVIQKYSIALRYLNPKDTKKQLHSMSLRDVEFIKSSLSSSEDNDIVKAVSLIQGVSEKEVYEMEIIDFFSIVISIKNQIDVIVRAEDNALTPSHIDVKWELVEGSKRMSKFGIYNTLESLSGGDALKYDAYLDMEYSKVFTILLMRKTSNDIQYDMSKLKTSKEID